MRAKASSKVTKSIVVAILILLGAFTAHTQARPAAIPLDEFAEIGCDDFLARIDNLFLTLQNRPHGSTAVILLTAPASKIISQMKYEQMTRAAIRQRRYDHLASSIVRRDFGDSLRIQFWIVPPGETLPEPPGGPAPAVLPVGVSTFNIRDGMSQICDPPPLEPLASELMSNYRRGMIYVVVNYDSKAELAQQMREAQEMVSPFPKSKIRYLLRRGGAWNDYWFVTRRIRKTAFFRCCAAVGHTGYDSPRGDERQEAHID